MRTEPFEAVADPEAPDVNDLDEVTSYEDEDGLVVCHKKNPKAWVRSDETRPLAP